MLRALWYKVLRGAVAAAIAGWWAKAQSDPKWLALIPVIQAVGKYIREKRPEWAWAIPF